MSEQELPKGTVEVKKTTADLKLGLTTIILAAEDEHRLDYYIKARYKIPFDFNCEIICVSTGTRMDEDFEEFRDSVKFLCVPEDVSKAGLQNIGRQLASKDSKYLLFLDDFEGMSKEWLEDRVKGFEYNPVVGIIGRGMPSIVDDLQKKLFDDLQGLIRLSDEDFKNRCFDKEGNFRNVSEQSLATSIEVFDRVGGFDTSNEHHSLVYQTRVQALGYGLVPQPN